MECPNCGFDLGEGMLPARCPQCGNNLANASDSPGTEEGARRAAQSRESVRGLSDFGREAPAKAREGRTGRFAIAIAIVAVFACCVGLLSWRLQLWGGSTPPDVVGWNMERAQSALEHRGFQTEVEQELSDEREGFVLSQSPEATARVSAGAKVTIVVSKSRRMPDLKGKTVDEARSALGEIGVPCEVEEKADDGKSGIVLSATAKKGDVLTSEDTVTLRVSRKRRVPSVVGEHQEKAQELLKAEGLKVKVSFVNSDKREWSVVSCDPVENTEIKKGATVTICVSQPYVKKIEGTAKSIIGIVYGSNPGSNGAAIGAAIRPYLSKTAAIAGTKGGVGVSDAALYKNLVKGNTALPAGVNPKLAYLPRSVASIDSLKGSTDGTVTATVTVRWDWSPLGKGYENVVSTDTHKVTMHFDKDGGLTSFSDPAGDVPAYTVG